MGIEIRLRPLNIDDIDNNYCSWYENIDGHLNYFSGSGKTFNREKLLKDYADGVESGKWFYYVIEAKSGEKIGNVKIGPIDTKNKTSDLVCLVGNRAFLGKGIATKAIALANEIAFKKHDIRRLHGGMHAHNIPSIKAYTKAGWFIEGIFRGYYWLNGVAEDRVCVACLNPFYFPSDQDTCDYPRAILLDLDGTLADSLEVMRLVYRRFLEQLQREPSDAEFDSLNGPPLSEVIRRLKVSHDLEEEESTLLSNYSNLIDLAYADVKPSLEAVDLLKKARDHHCNIGIVTSNTRKRTQKWLETFRLSHMIDFIVAGDEVKRGKPHPEIYLIASKKTLCKPAEIVVIEDSPQGATSAVGAGLKTFVLGYDKSHSWPQGVEPIRSLGHAAKILWHNNRRDF